MEKLIAEKQSYVEIIRAGRKNIAKLKADKIKARADAWSEAEGIADAKKDYVRSQVADVDLEISNEEANIEYCYNMIDIINDKLVLTDE